MIFKFNIGDIIKINTQIDGKEVVFPWYRQWAEKHNLDQWVYSRQPTANGNKYKITCKGMHCDGGKKLYGIEHIETCEQYIVDEEDISRIQPVQLELF